MAKEVKAARIVLHDQILLLECPHCGMTLVKTNYVKARKLLENTGPPPGKVCEKCGGEVIVKLNEEAKNQIKAKSESSQ